MDLASVRAAASLVTSLGWQIFGVGIACTVGGLWLDWRELDLAAVACGLVLLIAIGYMFGRPELDPKIALNLHRVTAGHNDRVEPDERAQARVTVRNVSPHRSRGLRVELPITLASGVNVRIEPLAVPSLAPGEVYTCDPFDLPTGQRGVVTIGPIRAARSDPLGLLRRETRWPVSAEFFVHPTTVGIDSTGAGLMRDLEGQVSNDLSMNDVAFHALREYEPGDSLRHVHALTSARMGRLMVRQFNDTRAAHLTVVVSGSANEYGDEAEFETALSIGGSLALRAIRDDQRVSVITPGNVRRSPARFTHRLLLDGFSRAWFNAPDSGLVRLASEAVHIAPETSLVALITGRRASVAQIRASAARFGPGVRVVGLRVVPGSSPEAQRAGRIRLLTVPALGDLRSAMRTAVRA